MKHILLHGLGQTSSSWEKVLGGMDDSLDIDCPDLFSLLRGRKVTYPELYKGFSEYCKACPEPVHLCGLSLGGILALQYGIENPDKVASMVLIGIQYVMPKRLLKFQNAVFHMMPSSSFRQMGLAKKDVLSLTSSMMELDFRQDLHRITCPVLVVCGEKDRANMKAAAELEALLPSAELKMIPNAGHEVNTDAPEKLSMVLNKLYLAEKEG